MVSTVLYHFNIGQARTAQETKTDATLEGYRQCTVICVYV